MGDTIYTVDPSTNELARAEGVSFADIGVKERSDLQDWVVKHPELLGEKLLIITPEFDRFDRSRRRLDVLALDSDGVLVVIELKLEAEHSLAELQAVRYAAFCSTMQMQDLVAELAGYESVSQEEATSRICEFLDEEELPELDDNPRIILAAGSFDDQELTSCVLWLRRFEIDISCVAVTPYRLLESSQIVLVSRVIIPLAEARDYTVSVEQKQGAQIHAGRGRVYERLWKAVSENFNRLGMPFQARSTKSAGYSRVCFGDPHVHYEWHIRKRENVLDVALHFETNEPEQNYALLEIVKSARDEITHGLSLGFEAQPWGKKWAEARFRLPYDVGTPPAEIAPLAADIMQVLIERTWPLVKDRVKHRQEYAYFSGDETNRNSPAADTSSKANTSCA